MTLGISSRSADQLLVEELTLLLSMDWFKGKFTGKPHISWENLWFPVDVPLNQSIETLLLWKITIEQIAKYQLQMGHFL